MARARNIKPGFFTNEDLVELDFAARLLFIGLWTEADREGRLEDRPKRLKMSIFPGDNVDVDQMLAALAKRGFIRRYSVGEQCLIQVVNWSRHQNPHHTEKASVLPAECEGSSTGLSPDNGDLTVNQRERDGEYPADSLIPDSITSHSLAQGSAAGSRDGRKVSQMSLDWFPSMQVLEPVARRAGMAINLFTPESISQFVVHHAAGGLMKTEAQWVASLVGWLKRDQAAAAGKGHNVAQFPSRNAAASADWTEGVML